MKLFDFEEEAPALWKASTITFLDYLHNGMVAEIQEGFPGSEEYRRNKAMYDTLTSCLETMVSLDLSCK